MFELLQTASGVGPRLALAMLAVHAPDALRRAVATEDLRRSPRCPASAEGRPAHRAGAQGPARRAGGRRVDAALDGGRPAAPGGTRSRRRWSASAGSARGGRRGRARRSRPRPASRRRRRRSLLRAALRTLGRACDDRRWRGLSGPMRSTRRWSPRTPTATSGPSRRRCGPSGWTSSSARTRVREQLVAGAGARACGAARPPDHVLLSGPPGLGKTTLAMIIAAELGAPLRITSGPAIQHAGDLAAILSTLAEGEVLFLDEIHRMARPAEEMLYLAMEDFRVDVVVGKGPGATAIPLEIAAVHPGRRHHPGRAAARRRCATGSASPAHMDFYAADRAGADAATARRGCSASPLDDGGRRRDRRPLARHAPHRQPAAAPGARLRRGRGRRRRHQEVARAALALYEVDEPGSTGSTGRCSTRSAAGSAAGRSACRRSRWRWGRSPRRSRRWPSRSSCARAARAHPARPGRHARGLGAPGADAAPGGRRRPGSWPCSRGLLFPARDDLDDDGEPAGRSVTGGGRFG